MAKEVIPAATCSTSFNVSAEKQSWRYQLPLGISPLKRDLETISQKLYVKKKLRFMQCSANSRRAKSKLTDKQKSHNQCHTPATFFHILLAYT
jgi:hypothetical protein